MREQSLKKKVKYLLESPKYGRKDAVEVISIIMRYGPTVIIGGMLRDLAVSGNREFCSDIDLVINPDDIELFEEQMMFLGAKKNKLGGYGLQAKKWKVDVWPLEKTWVKEKGYREVNHFKDLLFTTFFNWDAILYDLNNDKIIADRQYFKNLKDHVLDINFEVSLNPLGNSIRAIRSVYKYDAYLTNRLAKYVYQNIKDIHDSDILQSEAQSHAYRFLDSDKLKSFRHEIEEYIALGSQNNFVYDADKQDSFLLEEA